MASSVVEICNNALGLLGDYIIDNFNDNTMTPARLCNTFYRGARDAVLRLHPWNFAVRRVRLAPRSESPVYGYSNAFPKPPELLRLLEVCGITDYKTEGRDILCDATGISIRYIYKNESVVEYDSLFVEALTAYMAWKLAYPITKSSTVRKEMWDMFTQILQVAKSVDAMEEPQDTIGDFPLINVRG